MSSTTTRSARDLEEPPEPAGGATSASAGGRGSARSRGSDPGWTRPAFWLLLAGTAVLYLWNLGASGNANDFYAAAVQAGTQSWKALFFGSLDAGNAITVDKPPASLWVMGLSGRIFGFSSWSMLVPDALEGVAAVALLHAAVRRWSGPVAALVAGAALALTPAAALIFRFNNPDALLVLLMVAGAYAVVRAVEVAGTRWLLLAGVALGFAFLTKMLQGFLVLPAFALVYLVAAPTSLRRRIMQLLGAGLAVVVSAGWWVAIVALWPASSRPYIGGSTDNSVLELAFGYNGLARILGGSGNGGGGGARRGPGGGGAGTSFGGSTGLSRLFSNEFGNEISWLLPAALVALVAGLWLTRRAARTDRTRAALVLWGTWLVVTGGVFSFMSGTIHPYYTVALAPAIAGLVAVGGHEVWRHRASAQGRVWMALLAASAGGWAFVLLGRNSSWLPALRWVLLALTVVAVVAALVPPRLLRRWGVAAGVAAVVCALVAGLGGTAAYGVATASTPHTGSIPSAGPASAASAGGFGGGRPRWQGQGQRQGQGPGQGGGASTNAALTGLLAKSSSRWAAAVIGAQSADGLELSSGASVMAIGGFSGSDPSPTLAQFKAYVSSGEIHYFIAGGGFGGGGFGGGRGGSGSVGTAITSWVEAHYTATTIGGQTVYDLTSPTS